MNDSSVTALRKILKDHGHSMTTARQKVCELLWNHEPQSMRELTERARGQVDRASLYRTVDLFERLGLVQRIYIGWKYKIELSDVLAHHHHHLSCMGCGKIVAITDEDDIEKVIRRIAAAHGFAVRQHQLEIQGYCAVCAAKQAR